MERETIKLKLTKTNKEVEINKWITAGEAGYIQEPALKHLSFRNNKEITPEISNIGAEFLKETNKRTIEKYIVKIDDITDKEKIYNTLMDDMPESDYTEVMNKINEISKPESQLKKA